MHQAMKDNAATVILAHNHPGGFAVPSEEDINATQELAKSLRDVDVFLADHIVVNNTEFISMVISDMYHPEELGITWGSK